MKGLCGPGGYGDGWWGAPENGLPLSGPPCGPPLFGEGPPGGPLLLWLLLLLLGPPEPGGFEPEEDDEDEFCGGFELFLLLSPAFPWICESSGRGGGMLVGCP